METYYKRKLRRLVGGWSETYESSLGSGLGQPDLQFLIDGVLVPIEVKAGVVKNEVIRPRKIRPSQIEWHDRFMKSGGVSFVAVCCGPLSRMDCWLTPGVNREVLAKWREGWPLIQCRQLVKSNQMVTDLSSLL